MYIFIYVSRRRGRRFSDYILVMLYMCINKNEEVYNRWNSDVANNNTFSKSFISKCYLYIEQRQRASVWISTTLFHTQYRTLYLNVHSVWVHIHILSRLCVIVMMAYKYNIQRNSFTQTLKAHENLGHFLSMCGVNHPPYVLCIKQ